jgi:hypothetical protein
MSERKARFRVGQVVAIRKGWMHEGRYFCVMDIMPGKDSPLYLFSDGTNSANEVALRPLTLREQGRTRRGGK